MFFCASRSLCPYWCRLPDHSFPDHSLTCLRQRHRGRLGAVTTLCRWRRENTDELSLILVSLFPLEPSAVEGTLRQGRIRADVHLLVNQQFRFGPCSRKSGKTVEADGVEGTISIPSVRVKNGQSIEHRICLFLGYTSTYRSVTQKDGQFGTRDDRSGHLCLGKGEATLICPVRS